MARVLFASNRRRRDDEKSGVGEPAGIAARRRTNTVALWRAATRGEATVNIERVGGIVRRSGRSLTPKRRLRGGAAPFTNTGTRPQATTTDTQADFARRRLARERLGYDRALPRAVKRLLERSIERRTAQRHQPDPISHRHRQRHRHRRHRSRPKNGREWQSQNSSRSCPIYVYSYIMVGARN